MTDTPPPPASAPPRRPTGLAGAMGFYRTLMRELPVAASLKPSKDNEPSHAAA